MHTDKPEVTKKTSSPKPKGTVKVEADNEGNPTYTDL